MKYITILIAILAACVQRNHYPNAPSDDIKFCRLEARMVAPVDQNETYNKCMEALGHFTYVQR